MNSPRVFESMWDQVREVARIRMSKGIETLSYHVHNEILPITSTDSITVISERTNKERMLRKKDFETVWNVLEEQRKMIMEDVPFVYNGRIIMAFLAHLPYVEYRLRPETLYLMDEETHEVGEKREHSD